MQPTRLLWVSQADLMAADTTNLAAATAMHLHIAKAPFVPSLDLDIGTLTEADFTGATALDAGTGTQPTYMDSADGLLTIRVKEPAGGWSFLCTADPVAPQTIYGWYLTDTADTVLLGSGLLPQPVVIQEAGQGFSIPEVTLKFAQEYPL